MQDDLLGQVRQRARRHMNTGRRLLLLMLLLLLLLLLLLQRWALFAPSMLDSGSFRRGTIIGGGRCGVTVGIPIHS